MNSINTTYLSPQQLYHSLKCMAILEIMILSQKDTYLRVCKKYPFRKAYSIDNGAGDTIDILFEDIGVFIKGFDHENELNQFGADKWNEDFFKYTYANVPKSFLDIYCENEEELYYMTFCMWYDNKQKCWKQNILPENDGGKDFLLGYICTNAKEWYEWAIYYFGMNIDIEIVEKVYKGETLTEKDIYKFNPQRDTKQALKEILDLEC